MVKGRAVKRYLVYDTCSVLHWGLCREADKTLTSSTGNERQAKKGVLLDWGLFSFLQGALDLSGTRGEHCCYEQTKTKSYKGSTC